MIRVRHVHQGAAIGQAPDASVDKHGEGGLFRIAGCGAVEEVGGGALQAGGQAGRQGAA